uniref:Methyltransferase FkbM domain-containing protein n=1 Tax=Timema bartmani TaxID=61472 RepID=A0A7R9F8J9_9NEOP|nr:unnamed protein product [Timema bartmani]
MNTYIPSNMFTKRNMLYLVVLLALFCIGIFTLHSQLLDSEERAHLFRTSSVLPEEIVKLYNYTEGYGDLNGPLVKQEDPRLVAKLATKFLIPPKHRDVPYHLEDPLVHDTSMGQAEKIMKLLNYKKKRAAIRASFTKIVKTTTDLFSVDGEKDLVTVETNHQLLRGKSTELANLDELSAEIASADEYKANWETMCIHIECGALDGETRSNTLVFERELGWNGLLIEADPFNFASMVTKNRKAYLSPSCLSIKSYPNIVSFQQLHNMGKISNSPVGQNKPGYVDVQCFPFYTYLLALNRTLIDYFSLDVEGNELDVLETIPFDKVDIQVRYWTGWTSRGDIGQGGCPGEILDRVDVKGVRPGEILDRVDVQGRYWTGCTPRGDIGQGVRPGEILDRDVRPGEILDRVYAQGRYWTRCTSRGDIGQGVRPGEILDKTLSVEFVHVAKGKEYLQMFMEKKGYVVDSEVTHSDNLANDFIFVKSTLRALDP